MYSLLSTSAHFHWFFICGRYSLDVWRKRRAIVQLKRVTIKTEKIWGKTLEFYGEGSSHKNIYYWENAFSNIWLESSFLFCVCYYILSHAFLFFLWFMKFPPWKHNSMCFIWIKRWLIWLNKIIICAEWLLEIMLCILGCFPWSWYMHLLAIWEDFFGSMDKRWLQFDVFSDDFYELQMLMLVSLGFLCVDLQRVQ